MPDATPRIFVVDDDDSIRRALSRLIRSWGYEVESFADAASFLGAPRPKHASCAILDVHMPALSGLELQAEIAKRGRELPIVFLTGQGDVPKAVRAMQGGAVDFLQKPASEAELRRAAASRQANTPRARDLAWRHFGRSQQGDRLPPGHHRAHRQGPSPAGYGEDGREVGRGARPSRRAPRRGARPRFVDVPFEWRRLRPDPIAIKVNNQP